MKTISFTINGNQEDIYGNPIPYHRVVGRALWLPSAKRYSAWKSFVRKTFYSEYPAYLERKGKDILTQKEPLTTSPALRARMDIQVYWMNGNHGDPDNIFKGIADALFINDKFLDGSFETNNAPDGKGRVVITITHNQ
ncbi:MAG: hypothetical protein KBB54_04500 [Candidatus Pacebacteria bacterium]|nr:hypothetical protein [Candidatus Paceibacterota bacterium]